MHLCPPTLSAPYQCPQYPSPHTAVRSTHSSILHQQSSSFHPALSAPHHYPHYPSPHSKAHTLLYFLPTNQFTPYNTLCITSVRTLAFAKPYGRSTHSCIFHQQPSSFPPTLSAIHQRPHYPSPHGTVGQQTPVFSTNNPVHSLPPSLYYISAQTTLRPTVRSTHFGILHQKSSSFPPTLSALHQCPHYPSPHSTVHTLRYSPSTIQFTPSRPLCSTSLLTLPFAQRYGPHTLRYSATISDTVRYRRCQQCEQHLLVHP